MTSLEALKMLHSVQLRQLRLCQQLDEHELERKGNITMVDPKVAALIAQFDTATDKIAARIQKLIDAGGLSAEDQSALQAEVDKLTALGQNPEVPIPAGT